MMSDAVFVARIIELMRNDEHGKDDEHLTEAAATLMSEYLGDDESLERFDRACSIYNFTVSQLLTPTIQ